MSIDQLLYAIADSIQMDLTWDHGKLCSETELDLGLLKGIQVRSELRIVDSVVDDWINTAGAILHVAGNLYLAMIADGREDKLTFFVVDGGPLGFGEKMLNNTRLGVLDKLGQHWSRKAFYELIAPGVKATFERYFLDDKWKQTSTGPKAALKYVASRNKGKKTKTAAEINKENENKRKAAVTGWKH